MLEISNLTILIDDHILVDKLNLILNKEDKLAVIGEEGNGKSTLLKAITQQLDYAKISGEIHTLHNRIGYLKQAFDDNELTMMVKDYLFIDEDEYYSYINELYTFLMQLKLEDSLLDKQINVLSGGEKVKLQLLKLLLNKPDILLLDEPSNDLDIETLQWLEKFIKNTKMPIMFISHDETLLSNCATRILHLEQLNKQTKCKHTIYNNGYQQYVNERKNKREKEIKIAHQEKADYLKKKEKLNNIQNAVHDALNDTVRNPKQAALLKKKMSNVKAMEKRFEKEGYATVDSIEENITLVFPPIQVASKKCILDYHLNELIVDNLTLAKNISLEVYGPKHIAIIGNNGCGKTTLLNEIYKHLKDRKDIKVGYMPQHYEQLLKQDQTPIDFLCPHQNKEEITWARKYLGNLNFTRKEMLSFIHQLSGGSKAKLILLHLMIEGYDVLLLDEPTRNISPLSNPVIRDTLKHYKGCMISISHDRKYIQEVCDCVYELTPTGLTSI